MQIDSVTGTKSPHTARHGLPAMVLLALAFLHVPALSQHVITAPPEVSFSIQRFEIVGPNPLGEARAQAVLQPYLGAQTGLDKLQQATQALEKALQAEGYGLYRVVLPPQDAVEAITLRIEPVKLGTVNVGGSKFHGRDNIRRSLPAVQENTTPNMQEVARQLFIGNENPSRRMGLRLSQSDDATAAINAEIEVDDSKTWAGLVGLNNSGTPDTGRTRLLGLLQHHNMFDRDHMLNLAYTTSPEKPDDVSQFGVYYRIPLYEPGGMVSAAYSRSSVNSGALGTGQEITGRGATMGISYTHYFHPRGPYRTSLVVGLDDRLFRAVTVGGVVLASGDVRSRPVKAEYHVQVQAAWGNANGSIGYARNLRSGEHNNNAAYSSNRAGADASWDAWSLSYGAVVRLPAGWLLNASGRAQYASEPLISGEQYGLGGAHSLRGLEERAVAGDSGVSLSLEAWSPELRPGLRALGFIDMGRVQRHSPAPGISARENLASVGFGLRYTLDKRASVSLDYGRVVRGGSTPGTGRGNDRLHVNILVQF